MLLRVKRAPRSRYRILLCTRSPHSPLQIIKPRQRMHRKHRLQILRRRILVDPTHVVRAHTVDDARNARVPVEPRIGDPARRFTTTSRPVTGAALSRTARTIPSAGSVQLGSVDSRIRHDTSGRESMTDAGSALTLSTVTPDGMRMSHSTLARPGIVSTPMPPSIRPVLTVMRRKARPPPRRTPLPPRTAPPRWCARPPRAAKARGPRPRSARGARAPRGSRPPSPRARPRRFPYRRRGPREASRCRRSASRRPPPPRRSRAGTACPTARLSPRRRRARARPRRSRHRGTPPG